MKMDTSLLSGLIMLLIYIDQLYLSLKIKYSGYVFNSIWHMDTPLWWTMKLKIERKQVIRVKNSGGVI